MINILVFLASILLSVAGQLLMKNGMNQFGAFPMTQLPFKIIPMFLNPWVFGGIACFGLSSVFWLSILSRLELSLVYPMVSLAYVLVAIASVIFFKENVSVLRWASIGIICLGVLFLSRS